MPEMSSPFLPSDAMPLHVSAYSVQIRDCLRIVTGKEDACLRDGQAEAVLSLAFHPADTTLLGRTGTGKTAISTAAGLLKVTVDRGRSRQAGIVGTGSSHVAVYIAPTVALVQSMARSSGAVGFAHGLRFIGGGLGRGGDEWGEQATVFVITPDQAVMNAHLRRILSTRPVSFLEVDEGHLIPPHSSFRASVCLLHLFLQDVLARSALLGGADFPPVRLRIASATIRRGRERGVLEDVLQQGVSAHTVLRLASPVSGLCAVTIEVPDSTAAWTGPDFERRFLLLLPGVEQAGLAGLASVIFCPEKKHCLDMCQRFNNTILPCGLRVAAHVYTGDSSSRLRLSICDALDCDPERGTLQVVFTTEALNVGADLKRVGFVGLLVILRTLEALRQSIGRFSHSGVLPGLLNSERAASAGALVQIPNAIILHGQHDINIYKAHGENLCWRLPPFQRRNVLKPFFDVVRSLVTRAGGQRVDGIPLSPAQSTVLSETALLLKSKADEESGVQLNFSEKNELLASIFLLLAPIVGCFISVSARAFAVVGLAPAFDLNAGPIGALHLQRRYAAYFFRAANEAHHGPPVLSRRDQERLGSSFALCYPVVCAAIGKRMAEVPVGNKREILCVRGPVPMLGITRSVDFPVSRLRDIVRNTISSRIASGSEGGVLAECVDMEGVVADLFKSLSPKPSSRLSSLKLGFKSRIASVTPVREPLVYPGSAEIFAKCLRAFQKERDLEIASLNEVQDFIDRSESACVLKLMDEYFGGENGEDVANCYCKHCGVN